jgi:hypothetical protein
MQSEKAICDYRVGFDLPKTMTVEQLSLALTTHMSRSVTVGNILIDGEKSKVSVDLNYSGRDGEGVWGNCKSDATRFMTNAFKKVGFKKTKFTAKRIQRLVVERRPNKKKNVKQDAR